MATNATMVLNQRHTEKVSLEFTSGFRPCLAWCVTHSTVKLKLIRGMYDIKSQLTEANIYEKTFWSKVTKWSITAPRYENTTSCNERSGGNLILVQWMLEAARV